MGFADVCAFTNSGSFVVCMYCVANEGGSLRIWEKDAWIGGKEQVCLVHRERPSRSCGLTRLCCGIP